MAIGTEQPAPHDDGSLEDPTESCSLSDSACLLEDKFLNVSLGMSHPLKEPSAGSTALRNLLLIPRRLFCPSVEVVFELDFRFFSH